MKKLLNFSLLAILAASFVLTGCKKDDDSNPGGETTKQDGILPKKVVKIVENYVGQEEYYGNTYLFDAEGRISSYTEKYGKHIDITTYTYTEDKCVWVWVYDNGEKTETINVENGRFVSYSTSTGNLGNKGEYTYTSDGYIKSQKCDYTGETVDTDNIEYTVTDGNITSYIDHYVEKYKNNEYIHDENTTLTYGNKLNNLNVDIVPIICYLNLYPGCCGKRCKNLPTSTSSIHKLTGDGQETSNRTELDEYTYTYDGDYLTKITRKQTDSEEGVSEYTYEIYYED